MFNVFKKPESKICANCLYCVEDLTRMTGTYEYATCSHPDLVEVDLVSGKKEYKFCSVLRTYKCGKKGKYYKANNEECNLFKVGK